MRASALFYIDFFTLMLYNHINFRGITNGQARYSQKPL